MKPTFLIWRPVLLCDTFQARVERSRVCRAVVAASPLYRAIDRLIEH